MGGKEIYRGNILEITGVRAYMMISEMLLHLWPPSRGWLLAQWGQFAWIEMDLFFVMSGFLITGILMDSRHKADYYRSFIIRRALRILPAYYLLLGVLMLALFIWRGPYWQLVRDWGSPFWFLIYLGNFTFAAAGSWPRAMMAFAPLWSLQIEEQFYLSFPFIVKRLSVEKLTRCLWTLVALSPVVRIALYFYNPNNPFLQYVLLPCRMEGLALGALVAIRFRKGPWQIPKKRLTAFTFGLLSATVALSIWSTSFGHEEAWGTAFNRTIGYSLSSFACTGFLLWMIIFRDCKVTAWLRIPVAQYLGKICYGTYIYHIPAFILVGAVASAMGWNFAPDSLLKFGLAYVLTYVLAAASWHIMEEPLSNMKDRLSGRKAKSDMDKNASGRLAANSAAV